MKYETVIGLEIHVELKTKSKAYCSCENKFGAEVNSKVCPICLGLPGALPALNEQVVEFAVRTGLALQSHINIYSKQDRKNYFYPDTAKAYQISQYDVPLCSGGKLDYIYNDAGQTKTITLDRIQIEEDAGKMLHNESFEGTLIDYNRSGVPLIEIVTNPDIRSGEEAKLFLETLRSTLIAIGVTDGKMQEGSIRCDVNVSVRPEGSDIFGTRVEMKNVNTFSGAARAIDYETNRQITILENGGIILQETRKWDDLAGENKVLRTKENADDYRYFPEPDLGIICVTEELLAKATAAQVELPHHKVLRIMQDYKIPLFDANLLVENPDKLDYFLNTKKLNATITSNSVSNWILGDISRILNEKNWTIAESKLTPQKLADMLVLIDSGTISNAAGKQIIEELMTTNKTTQELVEEKNLSQISDDSILTEMVKEVLAEFPQTLDQYKNGKTNVIGFLVGQTMKKSKGQGNPEIIKAIILKYMD